MISLLVLWNVVLSVALAYALWRDRGKVLVTAEEAKLLSDAIVKACASGEIAVKNTHTLLSSVLDHQKEIVSLRDDLDHLSSAAVMRDEAVC